MYDRQQFSREAALNGSCCSCVTSPLIIPHTGCADDQQESALQNRRTLYRDLSLRKPSSEAPSSAQQVPKDHGIRKFLLEVRLHCHVKPGRCRSLSPPTIKTHAAAQCAHQIGKSVSRPYVPTVEGGAVIHGPLASGMSFSNMYSAALHLHSESSRPTLRRCRWSLGPPSRALGAGLSNNNNNNC